MIQTGIKFEDDIEIRDQQKRDKYFVQIAVRKNKNVDDRVQIRISPDAMEYFGFTAEDKVKFYFEGDIMAVQRSERGLTLCGKDTLYATTVTKKHSEIHPDLTDGYTKSFKKHEVIYIRSESNILLNVTQEA